MLFRAFLNRIPKRTMAIDIGGMRKPYLNEKEAFDIKDLTSKEPFQQFTSWFEEAKKTAGMQLHKCRTTSILQLSLLPIYLFGLNFVCFADSVYFADF